MVKHTAELIRALLCALLFTACSPAPSEWTSRTVESSVFVCNSLTLPPKNRYQNLEVNFIQDACEVKIYLTVYALAFPAEPKNVDVTFVIEDLATTFSSPVLEGGHRILLPSDAKELLLNTLHAKKEVMIRAGRYSAIVSPEAFEENFIPFKAI